VFLWVKGIFAHFYFCISLLLLYYLQRHFGLLWSKIYFWSEYRSHSGIIIREVDVSNQKYSIQRSQIKNWKIQYYTWKGPLCSYWSYRAIYSTWKATYQTKTSQEGQEYCRYIANQLPFVLGLTTLTIIAILVKKTTLTFANVVTRTTLTIAIVGYSSPCIDEIILAILLVFAFFSIYSLDV
jgi:hypothetical protein